SHRLRINIAHGIREDSTRDVIENLRLKDVNSGEHQRRLRIVARVRSRLRIVWLWEAGKFRDAAIFSDFHFAETFPFGIRDEHEGGKRLAIAMSSYRRPEINISDDFAINDNKGLFVELIAHVIQRARSAEDFRLFDRVIDLNPITHSVAD